MLFFLQRIPVISGCMATKEVRLGLRNLFALAQITCDHGTNFGQTIWSARRTAIESADLIPVQRAAKTAILQAIEAHGI